MLKSRFWSNWILGSIASLFILTSTACIPPELIRPNPNYKAQQPKPTESKKEPQKIIKKPRSSTPPVSSGSTALTSPEKQLVDEGEIDFGDAFGDTSAAGTTVAAKPLPPKVATNKPAKSPVQPTVESSALSVFNTTEATYTVPTKMVRILLKESEEPTNVGVKDTMVAGDGQLAHQKKFSGVVSVQRSMWNSGTVVFDAGDVRVECTMPCTLVAPCSTASFMVGAVSYRGSLIVQLSRNAKLQFINYLDVESYLRGVVPLEIGRNRSAQESEALKAQAVAARTYTYKRIFQKMGEPYDLVTTVADQVYNGVNAEAATCDDAIARTRDRILVYGDSLVMAYYHSTCGGITANVENVWESRPPTPYLVSIPDLDKDGTAYCAISPVFTWETVWKPSHLMPVVTKFSKTALGRDKEISGSLRSVKVTSRFADGRIKECCFETSHGTDCVFGDKIRFVLRRSDAGNPILRSSKFEIVEQSAKKIVLRGKGFGHGIGMCQMGAIGRARAGQSHETILKAYYSGVSIRLAK